MPQQFFKGTPKKSKIADESLPVASFGNIADKNKISKAPGRGAAGLKVKKPKRGLPKPSPVGAIRGGPSILKPGEKLPEFRLPFVTPPAQPSQFAGGKTTKAEFPPTFELFKPEAEVKPTVPLAPITDAEKIAGLTEQTRALQRQIGKQQVQPPAIVPTPPPTEPIGITETPSPFVGITQPDFSKTTLGLDTSIPAETPPDKKAALYRGLIEGGLALLAGTQPTRTPQSTLAHIGRGGLAGLGAFERDIARQREEDRLKREFAFREQELGLRRQGLVSDIEQRRFQNQFAVQQAKANWELGLKRLGLEKQRLDAFKERANKDDRFEKALNSAYRIASNSALQYLQNNPGLSDSDYQNYFTEIVDLQMSGFGYPDVFEQGALSVPGEGGFFTSFFKKTTPAKPGGKPRSRLQAQ